MIITIPTVGYFPGDTIPITIDVNNESNVRILNLKVTLKRTEVFIAYVPDEIIKRRKFIMAESSIGSFDAHTSNEVRHMFELPQLTPSGLYCDIIERQYDLMV